MAADRLHRCPDIRAVLLEYSALGDVTGGIIRMDGSSGDVLALGSAYRIGVGEAVD